MKIHEIASYTPPMLSVGDIVMKGKFKNSPAEIKGFIKDKHNQPILKTNKGPISLFKPRVAKLIEGTLTGTYIHETSPDAASIIAKTGFKPSFTGIFFNRDGVSYSGAGYGKTHIIAELHISKLLDMEEDPPDELDELADGEEIAEYARKHGYQAWADDLQIAVLDTRCIKIVGIK